MLLGSDLIFGLSVMEAGALLAASAYLVSLARDWRPAKSLRQENRELREDLDEARQEITALKVQVAELQKATVPVLQAELATVARILERLDGSVAANTAAVQLVASQSVIADALDTHDAK